MESRSTNTREHFASSQPPRAPAAVHAELHAPAEFEDSASTAGKAELRKTVAPAEIRGVRLALLGRQSGDAGDLLLDLLGELGFPPIQRLRLDGGLRQGRRQRQKGVERRELSL